MSDSAHIERLLCAVRRALEPLQEVRAALLFGSQASGGARPDSDIDIAVLLDAAPSTSHRKGLLFSLNTALAQELRSDRLDVVILNDAPVKLAFRALQHGQVAFQRDETTLHRFRVGTYSRHADYEPVERFFRATTKARALREAARG
jgi:uncharacterized protein